MPPVMTSITALDAGRIAVKSFDPVTSRLMRLQHDSTEGRDALYKSTQNPQRLTGSY